MRLRKHLLFILLFTVISLLNLQKAFSQCTNCGTNYPTGTITPSSATWSLYGSSTQLSGGYQFFTLSTSYIYQFSTYGSALNAQLTLYPSTTCDAPYALAYNDDYDVSGDMDGSTSPYNQSAVIAYYPGTTDVRLLFSAYNCTSNGGSYNGYYRAIPYNPSAFTSSVTTICTGGSVTLTAPSAEVSPTDNDAV